MNEIKEVRRVQLFLLHMMSLCLIYLLFNLVLLKLLSPDVRTFLLMDKIQNSSDASEDEDDKVSNLFFSPSCIFVFLLSTSFELMLYSGVVRSSTSVFVVSRHFPSFFYGVAQTKE